MALVATPSQLPSTVSGTYTGTGASLKVTIGFQPSWIIGWNMTAQDTVYLWHTSSQTTFVRIILAAATVTAAIVPSDHGFTLPASDDDCNENTVVYAFIAGR